ERLGVSGVFAAAAAGLVCGHFWSYALGAKSRLQAVAVWDTLDFLLNAVLFLLLGLQLPVVLAESGARDRGRLLAVGLGISVVAIALRLGWMFAGAVLAHLRSRETPLRANVIALLAWWGRRGVLSVATALAVPATLAGGAPFPGRAEILFYAFSVIVVTLVVQGLPLPWIIRWLDIPRDEPRHEED